MKTFATQIRTAAKNPMHTTTEHHPAHAQALRAAVRATGKKIHELTAYELIELNRNVQQQLEAKAHERSN